MDADWETPATINDTWGFKTTTTTGSRPEDLIRKLVDVASKGGNYLLNVGPTAEGVIPQPSVDRLQAVGAWLERNGEPRLRHPARPPAGLAWARSTMAPGRLFLHVLEWPAGGRLELPLAPDLAGAVTRATLLDGQGADLSLIRHAGGLTVQGPESAPDPVDTVLALDVPGVIPAT